MKIGSTLPQEYPNEKDANFALFHFVSSVDAIEKLVTEGINKASADEIERYKNKAEQSAKEAKVKFLLSQEWTSFGSDLSPPKALCCSLAISSSAQEDQLKIKFYDNHFVHFKGVGVAIEDPKKVLVPHADYYAYGSKGILPLQLTKETLSGLSEHYIIKPNDLRKLDKGLKKPVRMGFMGRIHLGVHSVTNYASWSREDKGKLENRGGEGGFMNFARNFYRTSLCGRSKYDDTKFGRKSKYYSLNPSTKKRPEANYTELLVYQKKEENNPVNGVVLNMDVLRFGNGDVEKLKALFTKNQNLALYIYDTKLEKDCIRKIIDTKEILSYLENIKNKMERGGAGFIYIFQSEESRIEIENLNSSLKPLDNKILATEDLAPAPAPAPVPAPVPVIAPAHTLSPKEKITEKFIGFYNSLDSKEKVIKFLKFLWGGGSDNNDYDVLKNGLANELKEIYTGDDSQKNIKALKLINEVNRERAIAKLMELNQAESDVAKKKETENFIATYRQIYSQHKLDIFLEQDEFDLGKQEMLIFVATKNKSNRLSKIDELQKLFKDDGHQVKDIEILSFLNSLQPDSDSPIAVQTQSLQKIWMEHESSLVSLGYKEEVKKIARRDFLLLAIEAMEKQVNKTSLEEYIKINYKETEFLKNFATKVEPILTAKTSRNPPAGIAPPPEFNQQKRNRQCNDFLDLVDYFKDDEGKSYLEGGALIGGVGGGLIGGGLCVSALGVGAILSAPIIMPVVVGASVGVAVGAVGGLVVGAIAKQVTQEKSTHPNK